MYGSAKQSTSTAPSSSNTQVVPTEASKVAFPQKLVDFDPSPFLPEPYLTAFEEPSKLLLGKQDISASAPITSPKTELWHLFWRWDGANRLCRALEDEVSEHFTCNLFCLAKPDGELRQIIDRRPRNSAEADPPKEGPKMGHASVFVNIVIPPNGCLRGSLDDLRNFYHAFRVSDDRALSTPVGPPWRSSDFSNSAALAALRRRRPDISIMPGTKVYACFAGLSMGDKWAPAIAQVSHEEVLKRFGALLDSEHLQLGYPLPRAPNGHYSGVCIDDKVCLQVFPKTVPEGATAEDEPGRDMVSLAQADHAYAAVGLQTHPKKVVRRASNFKVWGAHFDGNSGMLSMDCTRLSWLCLVTAQITQVGLCTQRLLEKVLGLWAFGFQFRRPLFSIFSEVYKTGHPAGDPLALFKLPRAAVQELQLACALGHVASTSLKAQVLGTLYGTDASPDGAGIVSCHVGSRIASELFRRLDGRGFHTRLLSPIASYLHSVGVEPQEPHFLIELPFSEASAETVSSIPSPVASLLEKSQKNAVHVSAPGHVDQGSAPPEIRDSKGAQRFVSHLWATQLAESLPWKVIRAYRFVRPNHINILEAHAHRTLMRICPRDCRLVCFQDSLVTLGASAKGRSSSDALNRVLRHSMSFQIAKNVYPGGVHCPTWALRADDPSRARAVRTARVPLPPWVLALKAGRVAEAQDSLDEASGTARSLGRWMLFIGVACLASSGNFATLSAWAQTVQRTARPQRPGQRTRHSGDGGSEGPTAHGLPSMGTAREPSVTAFGSVGCQSANSSGSVGGRVREDPLRTGSHSPRLRRDGEHSGPKVPLLA